MPRTRPYAVRKRKRQSVPLKRKRYRAVRVTRPQTTGFSKIGAGHAFPTRWKRKVNYCEKISIDPATSGLAVAHYFSANSLFDPNRSGVGHQPNGFDQLMAAYDHYAVTKAKLTLTVDNDGNNTGVLVGIGARDTQSGTSVPASLIEQGRCVYTGVGAAGGPTIKDLSLTIDVGKFLGGRDVLADPQLKGSSTASPTEEAFFQIWAAAMGTNDPAAVNMIVKVEYDAYFMEPKQLLQS